MEYKSKEREPEVEKEAQSTAVEAISVTFIDDERLKQKICFCAFKDIMLC